jgi:hypothetical protein
MTGWAAVETLATIAAILRKLTAQLAEMERRIRLDRSEPTS